MRRLAAVSLLTSTLAAVGLLILPAAAAAQPLVTLDRVGEWTLDRLGYADGRVSVLATPAPRPAGFAGRRTFLYALPAGAKQGPHRWYTLDLHVAVTLRKDSGSGDVFVDGETDGWDAVQLELHVSRTKRGFTTQWDTYDLVDGSRHGEERGQTVVIDERNYLVQSGVRPGLNKLAIRLEEYQRARVQSLQALPDSAIGVTTVAVPTVHLMVNTGNPTVVAGHDFTIGYTLTSSGAAAKQVAVYPTIDPKVLAFVGPSVRRYAQLHGAVSGRFEFKALKVATTKIVFRAMSSANNQPLVEVGVRIDPATAEGSTATLVAAAIGLLLCAFIGTSRRSRQLARSVARFGSRARHESR